MPDNFVYKKFCENNVPYTINYAEGIQGQILSKAFLLSFFKARIVLDTFHFVLKGIIVLRIYDIPIVRMKSDYRELTEMVFVESQ